MTATSKSRAFAPQLELMKAWSEYLVDSDPAKPQTPRSPVDEAELAILDAVEARIDADAAQSCAPAPR